MVLVVEYCVFRDISALPSLSGRGPGRIANQRLGLHVPHDPASTLVNAKLMGLQ
jgi:hypothetical protein